MIRPNETCLTYIKRLERELEETSEAINAAEDALSREEDRANQLEEDLITVVCP